ncbi:hypothetical protein BDV24DRAFT_156592 [Aspergillus arachidicola]|uniref:Protein kinase domain-containing protein n=1 Tax=Aspergillus arachidicola TaxID=656916 RepID=A0A5N6XPY7_9EURO|nr:hypothetical protein BDV24DRAFT_156592 [Aspergillus arachidicola]
MAPPKKLGSPIELPVRRSTVIPVTLFPSVSFRKDHGRGEFVKHGSPYNQEDRLFFGLNPPWNNVHAIEFKEGRPVSFVTHQKVETKNISLDRIRQISHANVLGFKEVFVLKDIIYFLRDQWGLTLNEILQLSPVFNLSEVEVAVICRAILQGLRYIHEQVDICYGNLTCSDILINEQGEVRIAGIGNSILQKPDPLGKAKDIQAVCHIARKLLRVEEAVDVRGTTGLLAQDFAGAPPATTAKGLLQHPFLEVSAAQWCLRPLHILCKIARERKYEVEST